MSQIPRIAPSLDCRTKLARGRWRVKLFPDAAEAVVTRRRADGPRDSFAPYPAEAATFDSAGARAKRQVRRYCAANRLAYLWSLTYAGEGTRDHALVRGHVRGFFRRLRMVVGRRFPYLWTTEWHPGGHGLHVHFALGEYVAQPAVAAAWGHGIVFVRGPKRKVYGQDAREQGRRVGRYVGKYVGKSPAAPSGKHRYEVAQGFQPQERLFAAHDLVAAVDLACAEMGGPPARIWDSASDPNWAAGRLIWLGWP